MSVRMCHVLGLHVALVIGACSDGSSGGGVLDVAATDAAATDTSESDGAIGDATTTTATDATVDDATTVTDATVDDATTATDATVDDATTATDATVDDATADDATADDATTATDATVDDTADVAPPSAHVVVNEVAAAGAPDDWIELFNAGDAAADLSGWLVRDADPLHGYVFPDGTTLDEGAYLVLTRGVELDFGLGSADSAELVDSDGVVADATSWVAGASPLDASWGRIPNGTGAFTTLATPTPGAVNVPNPSGQCGNGVLDPGEACDGQELGGITCAALGWGGGALACADACKRIDQSGCTARAHGVLINEVTSSGDDLVELVNSGGATVDLGGWSLLDDAANAYLFPGGTTLAAGARLVLTKGVDHAFGLGGADAVILVDDSGATIDTADWQSGEAVVSYCRIPDATGGFRACSVATFGAVNEP